VQESAVRQAAQQAFEGQRVQPKLEPIGFQALVVGGRDPVGFVVDQDQFPAFLEPEVDLAAEDDVAEGKQECRSRPERVARAARCPSGVWANAPASSRASGWGVSTSSPAKRACAWMPSWMGSGQAEHVPRRGELKHVPRRGGSSGGGKSERRRSKSPRRSNRTARLLPGGERSPRRGLSGGFRLEGPSGIAAGAGRGATNLTQGEVLFPANDSARWSSARVMAT